MKHSIMIRACQHCHAENLVFFLPEPNYESTFEIPCPVCDKASLEAFPASKIFKIVAQHHIAPRSVECNPPLLPKKTE
jgi:hypothetical protein